MNSTFYGVPRQTVTAGWASRTPDDFAFAIKLYPVSGVYRREMLARYPELEGVVTTSPAPAPLLVPAGGSSERR